MHTHSFSAESFAILPQKENSKAIKPCCCFLLFATLDINREAAESFPRSLLRSLLTKGLKIFILFFLFTLLHSHKISQRQGCYCIEGAVGGDTCGVFVEGLTAYHGGIVAAKGNRRDIKLNAVLPAALLQHFSQG